MPLPLPRARHINCARLLSVACVPIPPAPPLSPPPPLPLHRNLLGALSQKAVTNPLKRERGIGIVATGTAAVLR